jgi:hypothetical protein
MTILRVRVALLEMVQPSGMRLLAAKKWSRLRAVHRTVPHRVGDAVHYLGRLVGIRNRM